MLKLNDQLIQKRLLWGTTIKAFTSCWLLQMWLTTITVVYKVLLFDSFCHLSTFTSSLNELLMDRRKIHISLVWKLAGNYKTIMGPGSDAKILLPDILHDLCRTVSSTCRRPKITLFNHRRLYHSWWFSRWWGVESNSMEASRSYNLYNRLLQLVTCRANDNQDDESDKWWW